MEMEGISCSLVDQSFLDVKGNLKPSPLLPLAQAYVPYQRYTTPMTPAQGFQKGTIWNELVREWVREEY